LKGRKRKRQVTSDDEDDENDEGIWWCDQLSFTMKKANSIFHTLRQDITCLYYMLLLL